MLNQFTLLIGQFSRNQFEQIFLKSFLSWRGTQEEMQSSDSSKNKL